MRRRKKGSKNAKIFGNQESKSRGIGLVTRLGMYVHTCI